MYFSSHLSDKQYFLSQKIDKNVVYLATTEDRSGLTRQELQCVVTRNETLSGYRNCIEGATIISLVFANCMVGGKASLVLGDYLLHPISLKLELVTDEPWSLDCQNVMLARSLLLSLLSPTPSLIWAQSGTIRLTGNCYLLHHTFMCHSIKMSVMEGVNVLKVIFELYSDLSTNTIKTYKSSNAPGQ